MKENTEKKTSAGRMIILGLQHLIAMFGATVLVPMLTGLPITVALLSAGIGTLIFHFVTDKKVPVFLGSSFAFIPVILQVKEMYNGDLAYATGGIFFSGLIYVALSFLIGKIGVEKIDKFLPARVIGPMIIVVGLNLIPTAIDMAMGNIYIALFTLFICLFITKFTKGFIKQLAILIAVTSGYLVALFTNNVDTSLITGAKFFSPPPVFLPKFDLGAILTICPIVIAVFMEHLGDIKTNGQVVGKDFITDPGLNKTLLGDGLATAVAGLLGGPANTTYGENTAVIAITKNYDTRVLSIAALFAIILSFFGKLGGLMQSIPAFVMGGISIILFSMIALVGVKTIKTNKVKFNFQNILIMGVILFLGFFGSFIEAKTGVVLGIKLTDAVAIKGLSFAALVGIILNAIVTKIEEKNETN